MITELIFFFFFLMDIVNYLHAFLANRFAGDTFLYLLVEYVSYIVKLFYCKVVTLRMDYVLVGTSLAQMTLTGRVVRDHYGPTTQVLPLDTVAMVSLL